MYCKKCGKKLSAIGKFCGYCGHKLNGRVVITEDPIMETSKEKEDIKYAGFWIRLGAYLIDLPVGMNVGAFAIAFVVSFLFGQEAVDALPDIFWNYFSYVIYSTFTLTIWSTTLGKHFYGLSVATEENKPLPLGRSLKRSLLQPLSTLFFGIGYWNMGKNLKNQAWHDKSARTVVVQKQRNLILAYIVTFISTLTWAYFSYGLE